MPTSTKLAEHRAWARFIGGRGLEKAFLNIHAPLLLFVLASGLMYFKNAYRQYRVAAKGDGAPGTIDELDVDDPTFDASLAGQLGSFSQQRALQQAAGRWVIPPQELKLGRRIGAGSFGGASRS